MGIFTRVKEAVCNLTDTIKIIKKRQEKFYTKLKKKLTQETLAPFKRIFWTEQIHFFLVSLSKCFD